MQWTDEGIVLGVKRHGEGSAILELMTREHGRHLGLVRGGAGRLMRPVLQTGNLVSAVWRAERDPHPLIVPMVETVLDHIDDATLASALVVQFELHLLSELGFGLELDACA